MSEENFDNFIRQKLKDHKSAVSPDLWNKIKAAEERELRGIFWWNNAGVISSIIIAVIFTAGTFIYYNNYTKPNASESKNIAALESKNQFENLEKRIDGGKTSNTINEDLKKLSLRDPSSSLVALKKDENLNSVSEEIMGENLVAGSRIQQKSKNYFQSHNSFKKINNRNQPVRRLLTSGLTGDKELQSLAVETIVANQLERQFFNPLLLLVSLEKNSGSAAFNADALKNLRPRVVTECPSINDRRRRNWFIEPFIAPDYSIKSSPQSSALNETYLRRKDSSETRLGSFTAGVRISKTTGAHTMIKSGLQYSQINEKFSYRTENEKKLVTVITIRTIIRNPGDTVIVKDTSTIEQIGYKVKTSYNKYRSLDIPLIASYEWGNEAWRASVNAGVILNLRSWQQGEMLDTSYTAVSFNKNNTTIFKQNIGFGLYGSLSLLKRIGEKTELFGEPYFRYNISDITNNKSAFQQKFDVVGINVGIRLKINNNRQQ